VGLNFIYDQGQSTEDNISRLLEDFLHTVVEEQSSTVIAHLISEYATPVITGILNYKFRSLRNLHNYHALQEIEDIQSDSILNVIAQLTRYKQNPSKYPITDFRGLVATITYRAYADFFRKRSPRRNSLVNRLRYVLSHAPGFAVWKSDVTMLCGYQIWQRRPQSSGDGHRSDILHTVASAAAAQFGEDDLKSLLTVIFDRVATPVPLDDLAAAVARALGVSDSPPVVADEEEFLPHAKTPDPTLTFDRQIQVHKLWKEILELPPRQRKALLLNFADRKENALAFLLIADCASIEEIATSLEMTPEELAAIWDSLPWEDSRIAENLDITRQQVINLRKSARERLHRRLKDFPYG
jgi:DNA-directed RNA polymerase specialized sigma24 family protein